MAQQTDKLYLVENKNTIRKLASLRNCRQLTDLQFVFPDGSQIDAHKAIVAQYSSVIAAKCVDIDQHKLQILSTDIDNEEMIEPNVMNIMLDYIYGQQVTILRDNIQQVMRLAIKLNVPEFLADCDNILFQSKPPVDKITGTHIKQEVTELGYDSQPARPSGRGRSGNSVSASKNVNKESPALKRTGTKRTIKKTVPEYIEPELDDIDDGMDDTIDNDDEEDTDEYEPDLEFKDENDDANYIDGTSAAPRKRQKSSSKKEKGGEEANVNPLVCELCDKTFETHKESAEHQRDVHNTIACDICAKVFNNEPDLRRHGVLHTENILIVTSLEGLPGAGAVMYNCRECKSHFPTKLGLIRHMRKHHGPRALFQCERCQEKLPLAEFCNHTLKKHQGVKWKDFRYCQSLDKAICEICGHLVSKATMETHKNSVHFKTETFVCDHKNCGKSFLSKAYLKRHMRVHGSETFACSICKKSFKSQIGLKLHQDISHSDNPGKSFQCNTCEKSYSCMQYLQEHKLRVHGTKYRCTYCDKSFGSKKIFQDHTRIHTGEKPYKCEQCNVSFTQTASLHKHKLSKSHLDRCPKGVEQQDNNVARGDVETNEIVGQANMNTGRENESSDVTVSQGNVVQSDTDIGQRDVDTCIGSRRMNNNQVNVNMGQTHAYLNQEKMKMGQSDINIGQINLNRDQEDLNTEEKDQHFCQRDVNLHVCEGNVDNTFGEVNVNMDQADVYLGQEGVIIGGREENMGKNGVSFGQLDMIVSHENL